MKSILTWLCGIIMGAALGYGLSFVVSISVYLLVIAGLVVGSSVAITLNIYRENKLPDLAPYLEDEDENDSDTEPES